MKEKNRKWFIISILIIFALFFLFGINAITYNSNSLTFQLNNIMINDNIIIIGIISIIFILMIYIGYRIAIS